MKPPPLLVGAALMFWGWQTGLWILAAGMALIFEGSRLIRLRWDLSADDFRRISDLCTILLVMLLIYLYVSDTSAYFLYVLLRWLPIAFFPLLVAQAYATSDRIDIRVLFLVLRKKRKKDAKQKHTALNLAYPYLAICLWSASAANVRDIYFYMGLFGIAALAFWMVRSQRFSAPLWLGLMVLAGCAGIVGHIGLHNLHLFLEEKGLEWINNSNRHELDPFQTKTAVGDIGSLKPSNRIVFRVKPEGPGVNPMLLREAIYDRYSFSWWFASDPAFTPVKPDKNGRTWRLNDALSNQRSITVSSSLYHGQGVLKLPTGVIQIDRLPAAKMARNRFGTVKVEGGPGRAAYRVGFKEESAFESPPTANDLSVPDKESPALNKIAGELELEKKSPREIVNTLDTFFQEKFSYSLELTGKGNHPSPLSTFLLKTRSGHCEYFATATVLLLRTVGIPARYVRGYSVHEFSRLENQFVVRDRHAHAWTRVHLDGLWQRFDTTPSSWVSIEDAAAPGWEFITDALSWGRFKLTQGLVYLKENGGIHYLWWLFIPVMLILLRRFYRRKKMQRLDVEKSAATPTPKVLAGSDSEFFAIEKVLHKAGFVRNPSDPPQTWFRRLKKSLPSAQWLDDLRPILALHYRYRFDPKGIQAAERTILKSDSLAWLEKHNNFTNNRSCQKG
jgi:hypothetical protein